jgi:hypothetical protein
MCAPTIESPDEDHVRADHKYLSGNGKIRSLAALFRPLALGRRHYPRAAAGRRISHFQGNPP